MPAYSGHSTASPASVALDILAGVLLRSAFGICPRLSVVFNLPIFVFSHWKLVLSSDHIL